MNVELLCFDDELDSGEDGQILFGPRAFEPDGGEAMRSLVLSMVVFVAGPAMAQTVVRGEDREVFKQVTKLVMRGTDIDGQPDRPEGLYIDARPKAKFASLVRLRRHFQPELQDSVTKL